MTDANAAYKQLHRASNAAAPSSHNLLSSLLVAAPQSFNDGTQVSGAARKSVTSPQRKQALGLQDPERAATVQ
ncbi:hypothetical protein VE02_02842 [Pseudogymnoascus sp. 03VT05]|nr:hypothetical protein VE02_02842 [Pseudogymnoascus sp. 03VT05]